MKVGKCTIVLWYIKKLIGNKIRMSFLVVGGEDGADTYGSIRMVGYIPSTSPN